MTEDDPEADDVQAMLARHLAYAHEHSLPEHVHALDVSGLVDERVSFYGVRNQDGDGDGDGVLLGIGALRHLDATHAEIKSMHTAAEARGRGVARLMVEHLLSVARERGYARVSLETGTDGAFLPARRLYGSFGFTRCEPFADYTRNPYSVCMTLPLDGLP